MVDVSQARPVGSTSRRSRTGHIDDVSPSVRTQATRRMVSTPAGKPNALGEALGNFFGLGRQIDADQHQRDLQRIRSENTQAVEKAEADVASRPTEARKAIMTGDYTSFMDPDFQDRRVVLDAFRIATAKSMAAEDFDSELEDKLLTLPDNVDPHAVYEGYLADKLKGADPVFAAQYANTVSGPARRAISELRDARIDRQTNLALDTTENNLFRGIADGSIPLTQGGVVAARNSYIGSLPHPSPKAVAIAEARFESDLATAAATGNMQALRMMEIADPEKDGTSIMSRSPELYVQARDAMLSEMQSIQSSEHLVAINNLENAIAMAEAGKASHNFDQLWGQLWAIREGHETPGAESSRWRSLRNKIVGMADDKADFSSIVQDVAAGRVADISPSKRSKINKAIFEGAFTEATGDPEVAEVLKYRHLGASGSGEALKAQSSTILLADADPVQFLERYESMKLLEAATAGGDMSLHLSKEAETFYHTLRSMEDAGLGEVSSLRATVRENAPQLGDPTTYLQDQLVSPGDGDSKKFGQGGVMAIAKTAFDDRVDPLAGFEEGGRWFGLRDARTPWDHASDQIKIDYMEAVNQAAFNLAAAGLPRDESTIAEVANRIMKGRVGYGLAPNGDIILQRNQSPQVQLDDQGRPVPGVRVSVEHLTHAQDELQTNTDLQGLMATFAGGPPALIQDQHTSAGAGLAIQPPGGIPAAIPAGMTFQVPKSALEDAGHASKFFEVVSEEGGVVTLRSQPIEAVDERGRFMVTDEVGMIYSETDKAWLPRYWPQPPRTTTTQDLSTRQQVDRELGSPDMDTQRQIESVPPGSVTLGSPVMGPNYTPAPSRERDAAKARVTQDALRAGQRTGQISPMLNTGTFTAGVFPLPSIDETYEKAVTASREQFGDLPSTGVGKKVERQLISVMNEVNGFNVLPYDAHSRRTASMGVVESDRSHALVGYGVNMSHPGLDEMLKQVGAVPPEGSRRPIMDQEQAARLSALVMRRDLQWLNEQLPGVTLTNHQLVPLLSLMQSSPWMGNVPKAITSDLLGALKQQNYSGAAKALGSYVPPGTPEHLREAALTRARRLALMFTGASS